jgi:colanic acid biosynthesis glycosyl transferase WcaI
LRILVLCPHFRPDVAPTGEVMSSIVAELAARGHTLHVVTSLPWYLGHEVEPGWTGRLVRHEDVSWGRITRVHPFPTDKGNIPARAVAFGGFTALATAAAMASPARPDVVLAMSPPLTLGPAGWAVARRFDVPFVFNIQDVFPDVAVQVGVITNPTVIAAASGVERTSYRMADAVTVLSDDLRENVEAKLRGRRDAKTKVRVIPNFVDTETIRPLPRENSYRREFGLEGATVVMYAGNLGYSQSVDLLLDAAVAFEHDRSVVFVINGGGSAREGLERRARGLDNVRFVDLQPRERLPEVLAAADVHVVTLKHGLAHSSVPSKTYSILAAGRPVIASVDAGTEIPRLVARAGAGLTVAPDDVEGFVKAVREVVDRPEVAAAWGAAGRAFVAEWASPAAVAAAYENLFDELVRTSGRGRVTGAHG